MKKTFNISWLVGLIFLSVSIITACGTATPTPALTPTAAPAGPRTLTVMTHDSFAVSEDVVKSFEAANNVKISFLASGDAGTALNKAILSKSNPLADVFYGVDNTFLSRALDEGIFEAYTSPLLDQIPDEFKLDPELRALPVDYGDVCLNYDQAFFQKKNLTPPETLEDLLKPEYKNLVVVENPAISSPGLAFLLATIAHFGEDGYLKYWQGLVDNDVLVVNDWESAYYTEFSRSGGERPIVLSYASSPAAEVLFASEPLDTSPTGVVTGPESCFRQIEFVGILKGSPNRDLAEKWVDFMLSTTFQEDVPEQMFVLPVNRQAKISDIFQKYNAIPEKPAFLAPEDISAKREQWIKDWTETVLR